MQVDRHPAAQAGARPRARRVATLPLITPWTHWIGH
jgi:hypothetical protein